VNLGRSKLASVPDVAVKLEGGTQNR